MWLKLLLFKTNGAKSYFCLATLLWTSMITGSSAAPSKPPFEERLIQIQNDLHNPSFLKVKFRQKLFKSLRKSTQISNGHATFQKPNQFRWTIDSPSAAEWLFDGKTLTQHFPDEKRASSYPAGHSSGREISSIVDMVLHPSSLLQKYNLTKLTEKAGVAQITFTPLHSIDLDKLEIKVHTRANVIASIHLFYQGGNRSDIEFFEHSTSKPSSGFLKLPKGTKIAGQHKK